MVLEAAVLLLLGPASSNLTRAQQITLVGRSVSTVVSEYHRMGDNAAPAASSADAVSNMAIEWEDL